MKAASLFNPQLVQMLSHLNHEYGKDVFIAANTNQMHMDFITNPQQFGMHLAFQSLIIFNFFIRKIRMKSYVTLIMATKSLIVRL